MKFFKSDVSQIAGPGGKDLNFLSGETEITEAEAVKIFDDFFDSDLDNAQEMKERAWNFVKTGADVNLNDVCISTRKK